MVVESRANQMATARSSKPMTKKMKKKRRSHHQCGRVEIQYKRHRGQPRIKNLEEDNDKEKERKRSTIARAQTSKIEEEKML